MTMTQPDSDTIMQTENIEDTRDILIFGAEGMLGHALQLVIPHAIALGREFDIAEKERTERIIEKIRPAIILNAAAFTDLDGCEDDPDRALLVNGYAPGYLAAAARKTDAVLVHYSCSDVFDGDKEGYDEESIPAPKSSYGVSKVLGETRVREELEDYRIIRSSWLFGPFGRNLVDDLLEQTGREISVPADFFGTPTFTLDLALGTTGIIFADPGIYHLTNEGVCSHYELAHEINPQTIPGGAVLGRAKRPRNAVLINTRAEPLRPWQEALNAYLDAKKMESDSDHTAG